MNLNFLLFSLCILFTTKVYGYFPNGTMLVDPPKNPESLDDFAHPNKGCPENSECDQVMGSMLQKFKILVEKLDSGEFDQNYKAKEMEKFRISFGLPVNFYTQQKADQSFKPLLHTTPCKNHNPRDKTLSQILLGEAFIKKIDSKKGFIQRGNTLHEIPIGELFAPAPVEVFFDSRPLKFYIPLGDKPLYIKDKSLIILREVEGFYYVLKISSNGDWQVIPFDMSLIGQYSEKNTKVECALDKSLSPTFDTNYCENIWSEDLKKTILVKYYRGCVL